MLAADEVSVTPSWASYVVLGQDVWEIRVPLGRYGSEQEGFDAANDANVRFAMDGNRAALWVRLHGREWLAHDDDVLISELSTGARQRLGSLLDVRDPEARMKAVAVLESSDLNYVMEPSDFVLSDLTLADFLKRYGDGYRPNTIGPVVEIDAGDEAAIEASAELLPMEMVGEELFVDIMDQPVYDGMHVIEEVAS